MEPISYQPIGIIRSPFNQAKGTPIQASAARGVRGQVEVFPEYAEGLNDLGGFSHIILLYHFHLAAPSSLTAKPFMDDREHGIFAIRGPSRPNSIGFSVVRLEKVDGNMLDIAGMDIVDGTPLLDIKPYVPEFDAAGATGIGWMAGKMERLPETNDDGRFSA